MKNEAFKSFNKILFHRSLHKSEVEILAEQYCEGAFVTYSPVFMQFVILFDYREEAVLPLYAIRIHFNET